MNRLNGYTQYYQSLEDNENYTYEYGVEILLPHIQHLKDKIIWCPFDKEWSSFVKVLKENGFKVVYSHIDENKDFFTYEPKEWDIIISNPPYKDKRKFIERCLNLGKPFALLLPTTILNDALINDLFTKYNAKLQLLIPYQRMEFFNKDRNISNKLSFKTSYFARDLFKQDIILLRKEDMKKEKMKDVK